VLTPGLPSDGGPWRAHAPVKIAPTGSRACAEAGGTNSRKSGPLIDTGFPAFEGGVDVSFTNSSAGGEEKAPHEAGPVNG
jgi:hypothetical protein